MSLAAIGSTGVRKRNPGQINDAIQFGPFQGQALKNMKVIKTEFKIP